jgi:putative transposase
MPFWRTYFHIVWSTKDRHPMIQALEQEIIGSSLKLTFTELDVIPHAIGYMPDHVHVVVSVPPKVAVADLVRRLKGASSHAVNSDRRRIELPTFRWQDEYGVLTFGEKALHEVTAYVSNQPAIHANRQTWPTMERTTDESQPA